MRNEEEIDGELRSGQVIELDTSRRRVLKAWGVFGTSGLGLKKAVETVNGDSAEGVPIGHTRDERGNPKRVRMVPKERKRRIKVYENMDRQKLRNEHEVINSITIKQHSTDETDLSIHLEIEENTRSTRRRLPDQIRGVPVTYEEKKVRWHASSDCPDPDNQARYCDEFSELVGGIQIGPGGNSFGSLCLVAYQDAYNYLIAITAKHVLDGASDPNSLYHPADFCNQGSYAGGEDAYDSSEDIWAADISAGTYPGDVGGTVSAISDITGYWTYAGISDETTTGSILHGRGREL